MLESEERRGEAPSSEDLGKKACKPYTINKLRESWTEQDHDMFLKAFQASAIQKHGTNEHVPPPRPKRKANPQKAAKNDLLSS